jgi:hypothetical protein
MMPDVKIGNLIYKGVSIIKVKTADGGTQKYVDNPSSFALNATASGLVGVNGSAATMVDLTVMSMSAVAAGEITE